MITTQEQRIEKFKKLYPIGTILYFDIVVHGRKNIYFKVLVVKDIIEVCTNQVTSVIGLTKNSNGLIKIDKEKLENFDDLISKIGMIVWNDSNAYHYNLL